jgi:hypothetical protein
LARNLILLRRIRNFCYLHTVLGVAVRLDELSRFRATNSIRYTTADRVP